MTSLPPDLHTLTGSYVLDALDDEERALFETHLAACSACQAEVDELQRTAGLLAETLRTPVSPQLRSQVLDAIKTTRQRAPVTPFRAVSRQTSWMKFSAVAAGVVLLAATGTLAVVVADLADQVNTLEQAASAAEQQGDLMARLLTNTETMIVQTGGDTGPQVRILMSARDGEGLLIADAMPQAPADHAYALWVVHHDGTITPAGVLRPDDDGNVMHLLTGQFTTASALDVTVELEQSTLPQPTGTSVMQIALTDRAT